MLPVVVTFVLFVVMFGAGSARYDNFFSGQVLLNLFIDNAYLIVLAVGMTFVILTGGIDLSVGSVVALSGVLAAKLLSIGWGPLPVMALVLAHRARAGPGSGAGHPLPRAAAVRGHAGRDVPGPRASAT